MEDFFPISMGMVQLKLSGFELLGISEECDASCLVYVCLWSGWPSFSSVAFA